MAKITVNTIANAVNAALANMEDTATLYEDITVNDVRDWFTNKIEQNATRAAKAKTRAAEKKAEANAPIVKAVKEALADGEAKTIKEMRNASEVLNEVSPQKIAAVLRTTEGFTVEKVKGVNTYKIG